MSRRPPVDAEGGAPGTSLELAYPEDVAVWIAEEGALDSARQSGYSVDADCAASKLLYFRLDVLYFPRGDGAIKRLRGPLDESQGGARAAAVADSSLDLVFDPGQPDLALIEAPRSLHA
jgi:hypothetical protein